MDYKQIAEEFQNPLKAYRGKPFWSWNGELRGDELVRQAHIMKEMGLGGYFMHSRAGLITEYLGDEWFELINEVADAAEKDGMEAWLYDEDRWPSGSAGGKVTIDPQLRMKSLYVYEMSPEQYEPRKDTYALFLARLDGINLWWYKEIQPCIPVAELKAIQNCVDSGNTGEWKVLRFCIVPDPCESNYNGTTYADTMKLAATERFIELTHEEYFKRCGDRIGRSIKGIFTDEPHRGHCMDNLREEQGIKSCAMCWTDDILEEFQKRYGYDARPILPELFYRYEGKSVAPIKLHYIDLADNLFLERFADPINNWCLQHNMIFTGHVLHEDSLMNQTVPEGSLMRFYEHMGNPGIDCLSEGSRNYWIVKQLSSVARQIGKKWLLSELYGCTGWQMSFKSYKAVGDWQALFGINVRCPHLSWYTMEGESKRDYPASILHQSPWYADFSKVEDYFARFGLVMSEGKAQCDVLLLNPIESVWCQAYIGWARWISNNSPDVAPIEKRYEELFHMLTDNHIDFDYGEEDMMSRLGSVESDANGLPVLKIGLASYHTVIVSNMLTIRPSTLVLLEAFQKAGGHVLFVGDVPTYVDAVPSERPARLAQVSTCIPYDEKSLVNAVASCSQYDIQIVTPPGHVAKDVYIQMRQDFGNDSYAFVILNTDRVHATGDVIVKIRIPAGYQVEEWNLETGERLDANSMATYSDGYISIATCLEAAGTRCYILTRAKATLPVSKSRKTLSVVTVTGDFKVTRNEPNVCVLDWVRWRFSGQDWSPMAEVLKADRQIRQKLGLEYRGGNMLQPWFAKITDTKHYGTVEMEYEFYIDILPKEDIYLAGERPEWNHYRMNGFALVNKDIHDFWIDDCFKKMKVPKEVLRKGRNTVTVEVDFMRTTNTEAVYLLGEFGVIIDGQKRTLAEIPSVIGCHNYSHYYMPFYTGNMTYHLTPDQYIRFLPALDGSKRVVLSPEHFTGSCIKVGTSSGQTILAWDPYEADVTEAVLRGETIDVTVVGTRRNVFGPLHENPPIGGTVGPGNFVREGNAWSDNYSLIDSGLTGILLKIQE